MLDNTEPGVLAALNPDQRDVLHRTALLILARHDPDAWREPSASPPAEEPDAPLDGDDELRSIENATVAVR
jgi:hypothetical protein